MKKIVVLIVILCFSCYKKEDLSSEFRNILIDYQNKFPVSNTEGKRIYIYSAYFWKSKKDTLVVLTRSSSGIIPNIKGFGIYEDANLKPTFIVDENNLSSRFILKKVTNIDKEFYWKEKIFREGSPPVYTYKVENAKLSLVKIDTIWNH